MSEDKSICPYGNKWLRCNEPTCIEEMDRLEVAVHCPHGFVAGCPVCMPKPAEEWDVSKNGTGPVNW